MERFIEIKCPRCSSSSVALVDGAHYRCAHCQATFLRDGPAAAPPTPFSQPNPYAHPQPVVAAFRPAPARPPGSSNAPLFAVLSVVAVLVLGGVAAGFVAFMSTRTTARPIATGGGSAGGGAIDVAATATAVDVPAPVPPKAAVEGTRQGSATGSPFWLTTYRNTGSVAIGSPAVRVSLFDAHGKRVGEQTGYSPIKALAPGATSEVLVLAMNAPAFARADVAPVDPEPVRYPEGQVSVKVTEESVQPNGGMANVVGTVQNTRTTHVRFVEIIAIGVNTNGQMVSFARGYATAKELAPNATTGFSVSTGTFDVEKPVKYRVSAIASEVR